MDAILDISTFFEAALEKQLFLHSHFSIFIYSIIMPLIYLSFETFFIACVDFF